MADSSRESLLAHQVENLQSEKRRLRLALRAAIQHAPPGQKFAVEKLLDETR